MRSRPCTHRRPNAARRNSLAKLLKAWQIVSLIIGAIFGFVVTPPDGIPDWLFSVIVILAVSLAPYAIYRILFAPVPTVEERDRTPPADRRCWLR